MALLPQDPTAGHYVGNIEDVQPVGLAILVFLSIVALVIPRRWASLPLTILICFVPAGQRVILFTLDFDFLRILLLVLWGRLILRAEFHPLRLNHLDRAIVIWALVSVVTGTILASTVEGFIGHAGHAADALMAYFFFRMVIWDMDDVLRIADALLALSLPVLVFFIIEHQTMHNLFSVLGGVPEITLIREGRLRCQGAFAHPILAGCFWAAPLPLYFISGVLGRRSWGIVLLGCSTSLALVMLSASSTPAMSVIFTLLAGAVYFFRRALPLYRWMLVATIIGLHMAMKAPVWHLIARIDISGGSTGDHRYQLIDQAIHRFNEWFLVGTPTTAHWGWGLDDVTNMYILEAVLGGLSRLVLFFSLIVLAFMGVSRTLRTPGISRAHRLSAWTLGSVLFVHCMNFMAVSYFGQIMVLWFLALASIGSLCNVPGALPLPPDNSGSRPLTMVRAPEPTRGTAVF